MTITGPAEQPQAGEPDEPAQEGSADGKDRPAAPGRRRRRLALAGTAVGLAVLLAVVVLVVRLPSSSTGRQGVRASASPAGTPMSPDEYQQALTTLDRDLTPSVQAVTAANTYVAASAAAGQVKIKVDADATVLDGLVAPPPVRVAHQHLVKAIHELSADAAIMADQAQKEIVCTGSSALVDLALSSGGVWLRAAAKELATADPGRAYTVGGFLPEVSATSITQDRRLGNGTMLKKPSRRGPNDLKINNKGTKDGVVILAPQGSKTATFMVYVRSGESYTVTGIADGTYEGYVVSGQDWDGATGVFARHCHYARPEGTLPMTSNRSDYTDAWMDLDTSNTPFFADGVDPDSFPR